MFILLLLPEMSPVSLFLPLLPAPLSLTIFCASLKTQLRWHLYQELFLEPSSLLWWLPVQILSFYFLPHLRVTCRQGQCLFVWFLKLSYLSLNSQHPHFPYTIFLLNCFIEHTETGLGDWIPQQWYCGEKSRLRIRCSSFKPLLFTSSVSLGKATFQISELGFPIHTMRIIIPVT